MTELPQIKQLGAPIVELVLLGTAIQCPSRAVDVIADLEQDDFSDPRRREVFQVIQMLNAAEVAPEPQLVLDRLQRSGRVRYTDDKNAGVLLHDAVSQATTQAAVPAYKEALIRARWRREADAFGLKLQRLADLGSDADLQQALNEALHELGRTIGRMTVDQSKEALGRRRAG